MTESHYADATVRLFQGDCLDVLRELPDASVDAVVTDPPYNLSFMAKPWDAYEGREDAGFAYWLAGLIDGEGHFAIKGHARGTYAPAFQLKMRADERGTLERIKRSLGVGTISDEKHEPNPMVKYVIQDKAGCQRLVDLLDKYPLRAEKQVDYWTWREAVCEWTSRPRGNRWHGRADTTRMEGLRGRLMENRAYTDVPWSGHEFQDWCRLWSAECLRVLKPGGHLLAFGGTRTWHRLACAVEDAGFEVRDSIAWLYGSGFPKSLDVSKAIDKAAGAEREVTGRYQPPNGKAWNLANDEARPGGDGQTLDGGRPRLRSESMDITAPATDDARTWQGWGTALKPAFETVVVARKPLAAGTVAGNVLAYGTGALNIDACRIEATEEDKASREARNGGTGLPEDSSYSGGWAARDRRRGIAAGRWPANVVLDDTQAAALDQQSGERPGFSTQNFHGGTAGKAEGWGNIGAVAGEHREGFNDTGGASRFFYTAKADATERVRVDGIAHPTVKPLALMRWLVRLVTPPGGTVLEPFAGSGTTVEACILEGFQCVAIEREADYLPLILQRIHRRRDPLAAVRASAAPDDDLGLFGLLDEDGAA